MTKKNELEGDYKMLDAMSKMLKEHQQHIRAIGKRVVNTGVRLDLKEGLVENLDIVSNHMRKAQAELDKAKKRLKLI
jgi:hypothetical protein